MSRTFATFTIVASLLVSGCTVTNPTDNPLDAPAVRTTLNAEADAALAKLYAQEPGSAALVKRARGVLIFPAIVSAGFVVGGSYGKGVLRVGGHTEAYYSATAAAVGLLAGAASKAVYVLFMTDSALNQFRASAGWTVGADASVSVLQAGADVDGNSVTAQKAVIGYVLTNEGLMANLSIDGTKFTRLTDL